MSTASSILSLNISHTKNDSVQSTFFLIHAIYQLFEVFSKKRNPYWIFFMESSLVASNATFKTRVPVDDSLLMIPK